MGIGWLIGVGATMVVVAGVIGDCGKSPSQEGWMWDEPDDANPINIRVLKSSLPFNPNTDLCYLFVDNQGLSDKP